MIGFHDFPSLANTTEEAITANKSKYFLLHLGLKTMKIIEKGEKLIKSSENELILNQEGYEHLKNI